MSEANRIKLICTVGPVSLDAVILKRMERLGVDLLRINMSHASIEQMKQMLNFIKKATRIPVCIDTEGAQIRTGLMKNNSIEVKKDSLIKLTAKYIIGGPTVFSLYPPQILEYLRPGTLLYVDYGGVLLFVTKNIRDKSAVARVICGGRIKSNRAVNLDREFNLPSLTKKDRLAVEYAKQIGVNTFALSFAQNRDAVRQLRAHAGKKATIISKVETRESVINLDGIIQSSDAILIDRGDLSREVPVEQIPALQKMIISKAHKRPLPVYVATNLLESMVSIPQPTRAEINDIANTLLDGANGLVLAAETAIGNYPVQCVSMVRKLIQQHQEELARKIFFTAKTYKEIPAAACGGTDPVTVDDRAYSGKRYQSKRLLVDSSVILNIQNIINGCYAPLKGFMGRDEIDSVLNQYRLLDGTIWTMPIVLEVKRSDISVGLGEELVLIDRQSRKPAAWLRVSDVYRFDKDYIASHWFGTTSSKHPGMQRLIKRGDCFIGGEVNLIQPVSFGFSEYFLSPSQVRSVFSHYGWSEVVAFHTRNIPHRAHEYIQKQALERSGADALFIHPVLGRKKPGDFTAEAIMAGYRALIEHYYPADRVFLSGFFADSWYCGPREAVFTALCRKNYGCSHFIVGRDHTGTGQFYDSKDVRALFEKLGDLGITPLYFDQVKYDTARKCYREVRPGATYPGMEEISGTAVRKYLVKGRIPPEWLVRKEVNSAILKMKNSGRDFLVP